MQRHKFKGSMIVLLQENIKKKVYVMHLSSLIMPSYVASSGN